LPEYSRRELIDRAHVAPLLAEIEQLRKLPTRWSEVFEQAEELKSVLAERDTLEARCEEQTELLDIWRTWLGAGRESCDTSGKVLWDRITAVLDPGIQAAPTAKDGAQ